jgi:hypothetical protein
MERTVITWIRQTEQNIDAILRMFGNNIIK